MSDTYAENGLRYIAESPAPEHGGFHPETVHIAVAALRLIQQLRDTSRERPE